MDNKQREVAQSCPTLCDPMDCSLPGSSVHGIFQAIVLEWVAISFSKGSSQPRDRTRVSCIVDRRFTIWATEDTCTLMSTSELFTIARTWKKPRWPLADEWIRKLWYIYTMEYSVQFSCSVVSDSLRPHELQHTRPPCPSPTPGVHSNSRPSSRWCHPAISSSVVPFSSCLQSLPASESFPMGQLFAWGGQRTGVSALASFLPKNTQDWYPYCIAQGTLLNVIWQPGWEGSLGENGYVYLYGWVALLCTWNYIITALLTSHTSI